jgi:Fur family ferric uptake transcriptional regulator
VKNENNIQLIQDTRLHDPDALLTALTQAGYSNTRARRAVLEAICRAGGQASPADLLVLGRAHHPALGLVTVYRTLELLEGLGVARKLHLEAGCHSYAISALAIQHGDPAARSIHEAAAHTHSHHIICQRCNRAVEFEGCDLGGVGAAVEAQTGFRVREHWLELFGVCPACQESESAHE